MADFFSFKIKKKVTPEPEAKFRGIFWITLPEGTFFQTFLQFLKIDENVYLTI